MAPKKSKEQMKKNLLKSIASTPKLEVEGAKLPIQPVILTGETLRGKEVVPAPTLPADYEYVNHPRHYNTHPSGVEAIDLCEVLSFNVGSAFKYVYRRDDKLTPIQDLQKAKWYIEREIQLLQATWRRYLPSWLHSMLVSNSNMSDYHYELADKVLRAEKNSHAKLFYNAVLHSTEVHNYAKQDLPVALKTIDGLISEYKKAADKQSRAKTKAKTTVK